MNQLYPIKFIPEFHHRIWGGDRLKKLLNKEIGSMDRCGESWELSAVEKHISKVANGFLKGNDLQELVEIYMGDLVGEKIYDRFGPEFPLLIKFIDAEDDLSIQVHPDDKLARERHGAYGKTEMWYVVAAEPGANLNSGFNRQVSREQFVQSLERGALISMLNFEEVQAGEAFFIPAGRIHAIGKGILVAEIQQTSDVTYRIYDYNRKDKHGKERKLHAELALDAIDYSFQNNYKSAYSAVRNQSSPIVTCPWFTTNILEFDRRVTKEYAHLDSFVIYICVDGICSVSWEAGEETIQKGETVLIPASLEMVTLSPHSGIVKLLEVYIE
jgi:mannose-6-phosphate isomerase